MIINLSDFMKKYGADFYNGGWVKKLTEIDDTKSKGYKYVGDFVSKACLKGLYEFEPGYYIVCSVEGSRKNRVNHVWLVKIDNDGIKVINKSPFIGEDWALQLLPLAKKVLEVKESTTENPLSRFSDEELIKEVYRRKLNELILDTK
ncbi:hypothetical protein IC801_08735 [Geobacillus sp. 44B]|nr:hypothetical protein IC801_08735 [Geobacillus sp. 44B]